MSWLAKLFYKTIDTSEVDDVHDNFDRVRSRILDDAQRIDELQSQLILLRAALIVIRDYTANQKSGTAKKVHRLASEALR